MLLLRRTRFPAFTPRHRRGGHSSSFQTYPQSSLDLILQIPGMTKIFEFLLISSCFLLPFLIHSLAEQHGRVKRQGGATVLTKAWNEALPGVSVSDF